MSREVVVALGIPLLICDKFVVSRDVTITVAVLVVTIVRRK